MTRSGRDLTRLGAASMFTHLILESRMMTTRYTKSERANLWDNAAELLQSIGRFQWEHVISGDPNDRLVMADWCADQGNGYVCIQWMEGFQREAAAKLKAALTHRPSVAKWFRQIRRSARMEYTLFDLTAFGLHQCATGGDGWVTDAKLLLQVPAELRPQILRAGEGHELEPDAERRFARILSTINQARAQGEVPIANAPTKVVYYDRPGADGFPRAELTRDDGHTLSIPLSYLRLIQAHHPTAELIAPRSHISAISAQVGGKVVAVCMPLSK